MNLEIEINHMVKHIEDKKRVIVLDKDIDIPEEQWRNVMRRVIGRHYQNLKNRGAGWTFPHHSLTLFKQLTDEKNMDQPSQAKSEVVVEEDANVPPLANKWEVVHDDTTIMDTPRTEKTKNVVVEMTTTLDYLQTESEKDIEKTETSINAPLVVATDKSKVVEEKTLSEDKNEIVEQEKPIIVLPLLTDGLKNVVEKSTLTDNHGVETESKDVSTMTFAPRKKDQSTQTIVISLRSSSNNLSDKPVQQKYKYDVDESMHEFCRKWLGMV